MRMLLLAGLLACPSPVPSPPPVIPVRPGFAVLVARGGAFAPDTLIATATWTNPQVPVDSVRLVIFGIVQDTLFVYKGSLPLNPTSQTWKHAIPAAAYPSAGTSTYDPHAEWFVFRGADIYPTSSPRVTITLGPLATPAAPVTGVNFSAVKRP